MLIFNACFEVLTKFQYLVKPEFFLHIYSISQRKFVHFANSKVSQHRIQ